MLATMRKCEENHIGVKRHKCELCGATFNQHSGLRKHNKSHTVGRLSKKKKQKNEKNTKRSKKENRAKTVVDIPKADVSMSS